MVIKKMIASGIPFSVICSWPWPSPRPAQNWVLLLHTFLLVIYRYNSTQCTNTQVNNYTSTQVHKCKSAQLHELAIVFKYTSEQVNKGNCTVALKLYSAPSK